MWSYQRERINAVDIKESGCYCNKPCCKPRTHSEKRVTLRTHRKGK